MIPSLSVVNRSDSEITLLWHNGHLSKILPFWLRDSCPCSQCTHHETYQRQVSTLSIPTNITFVSLTQTNDGLKVRWSDGHEAFLGVALLWELVANVSNQVKEPSTGTSKLWGDDIITEHNFPYFDYSEVLNSQKTFHSWLESIYDYGFAILRNSPMNPEKTRQVCEKIGVLRSSIFGSFWDIKLNQNDDDVLEYADTAYSAQNLEPHTDGTYSIDSPGLQTFHIMEHTGIGGETYLVDGWKVANELKEKDPVVFNYLSTQKIEFHYSDKENSIRNFARVINVNDQGDIVQVRYNNDDRAPPPIYYSAKEMQEYYRALRTFLDGIQKSQNRVRFQLKPDNILITNNWRVLHGRTRFTGSRRLLGCYIPMEVFLSKLRVCRRTTSSFAS